MRAVREFTGRCVASVRSFAEASSPSAAEVRFMGYTDKMRAPNLPAPSPGPLAAPLHFWGERSVATGSPPRVLGQSESHPLSKRQATPPGGRHWLMAPLDRGGLPAHFSACAAGRAVHSYQPGHLGGTRGTRTGSPAWLPSIGVKGPGASRLAGAQEPAAG